MFRDAALLSAGALDQLYLAVRLAICELVLPPEKQMCIRDSSRAGLWSWGTV